MPEPRSAEDEVPTCQLCGTRGDDCGCYDDYDDDPKQADVPPCRQCGNEQPENQCL